MFFSLLQVLPLLLYLGGDYVQSSLAYSLTGFKQEVQFIFHNLVFLPFLISLAIVNTYKLTAILELKRGKYAR